MPKKMLIMLNIAGSGSEEVNRRQKAKKMTLFVLFGSDSLRIPWQEKRQQQHKEQKQNKGPCSVCLEATHPEC